MDETDRRRVIQEAYNKEHGIVPATVIRAVMNINPASGTTDYFEIPKVRSTDRAGKNGKIADVDISEQIRAMRTEMFTAAEALDFERAARLRDELKRVEALAGKDGIAVDGSTYDPYQGPPGGTKKAKARSSRGTSSSGNAASKAKASGGGRRSKR